jgi:hypothetical protein
VAKPSIPSDTMVVEREVSPTLPTAGGDAVNAQVSTARKFPRSITSFIRRATELATLTPEIAASCVYALPRGGKAIEGPSVRMAEIIAHAWGNLRIQAGATESDAKYITARGEAWDVESNVAIAFEVRRRITNREGKTYDDDMITVTGNAAASIALRNAVFKTVPSSFWKPIYQKCRQVIAGDAKTFAARRDDMLKAFLVAGVTTERLCASLSLKGPQDLTLEHMATLVGILNAIKEGETSIEDAFPEESASPKPAPRKSQQQPTGDAGVISQAAVDGIKKAWEAAAPESTANPKIGAIVRIQPVPKGVLIHLSTGFIAGTTDPDLLTVADIHLRTGVIVELICEAPRTPKHAPKITEILEYGAREPGSDDE